MVESEAGDAASYEPQLFVQLAALEPGHFWFVARRRLIIWVVRRSAPSARTFLEVGCGTGFVLGGLAEAFPALEVCGLDLFEEGLSVARQRAPRADLVQGDALDLPFFETFDVVGAFDVIEHLDDDRAALRQMWSAVRPGGVIILTVPQHPWLWSAFDVASHHRRRYTKTELQEKLKETGFEEVESFSFVSLLLPLMAARRVLRRDAAATSRTVVEELRQGHVSNFASDAVMRVEFAAVRCGMRFPLGGSRLVTARRPAALP